MISAKHLAMEGIMGALGGGPAGAIESMSRTVHGSSTYASLELPGAAGATLDFLLKQGFEFKDGVTKGFLCSVKAPPGWSVRPTDHWLYKKLHDPSGQARCDLMVHFQDHDSRISLCPKYSVGEWHAFYRYQAPGHACIWDSNREIMWLGKLGTKEEDAKALLDELSKDKDPASFFETPLVFPPTEYDWKTLKDYTYHTAFYHRPTDTSPGDQGSERFKAQSDEEAIAHMVESTKKSLGGYYVQTTLYGADHKQLWQHDQRQQAPKRAGRSVNGLGGWHAWP